MVLLHICCGICASWCIEKLKAEGRGVTGYFYNANIEPADEYQRRLNVAVDVCRIYDIPLIEGAYDNSRWLESIAGFEHEPEGGLRCHACFRMRLAAAAACAQERGIEHITTTLTISPHKDAQVINNIGKSIAPHGFLVYNFKKEDGFKKANEFAKSHYLYRQHYCGCHFSMQAVNDTTKGR